MKHVERVGRPYQFLELADVCLYTYAADAGLRIVVNDTALHCLSLESLTTDVLSLPAGHLAAPEPSAMWNRAMWNLVLAAADFAPHEVQQTAAMDH